MENNAGTQPLINLVKQFERLEVDDYQRAYTWRSEDITALYDDLKECVRDKDNHFFGTLIIQQGQAGVSKVVDGQQRLTTTFILVAAIRDELNKLSVKMLQGDGDDPEIWVAQRANEYLLFNNKASQPRFLANRLIRKEMNEVVFAPSDKQKSLEELEDSSITSRFKSAVKILRSLVADDLKEFDSDEGKLRRINSLLDALLDRFHVLRVVTTTVGESLDIFMTLNARGVPLAASDLVRGEVISLLGSGLSEAEQIALHSKMLDQWKTVIERVDDVETYMRHFLLFDGDSKVQKNKILKTVLEVIDPKTDKPRRNQQAKVEAARTFWDAFVDTSKIYSDVLACQLGNDEVQFRLELLEGLGTSHRPLVMAIAKKTDDVKQQEKTITLLNSLAYRWTIAKENAQTLEDQLQTWARDLLKNADFNKLDTEISEALANLKMDTLSFLQEKGDTSFVTRGLLHGINHYLADGSNEVKLGKTLQLEHIAPQKPTENWLNDLLPHEVPNEAKYKKLIKQAGNLALLDWKLNIKAQQKAFVTKTADYYNKSTVFVTRDLGTLGYSEWIADDINNRTDWLAEMVDALWPQKNTKVSFVSFSKWAEDNIGE